MPAPNASSFPPGSLSGRRILVPLCEPSAPSFADEQKFENILALACRIAGFGALAILIPVGLPFSTPLLSRIALMDNVEVGAVDCIACPRQDAACAQNDLARLADRRQADMLLIAEPLLAGLKPKGLPTVVVLWSMPLRGFSEREHLSLAAADRILVSTPDIARHPDLRLIGAMTAVVPPVFRSAPAADLRPPQPRPLIAAGAMQADPRCLDWLDRASAMIGGQVLALEPAPARLENVHRLAPMSGRAADDLIAGASAFFCAAQGPAFDGVALRAAALGTALIMPDTAAHREIWQGAARFVTPGDVESLAATLRRMLEDADHRRHHAAAALRRARVLAMGPSAENLRRTLCEALEATPLTVVA